MSTSCAGEKVNELSERVEEGRRVREREKFV
jgi:hypothetical protein